MATSLFKTEVTYSTKKYSPGWMGGWMDGCKSGVKDWAPTVKNEHFIVILILSNVML